MSVNLENHPDIPGFHFGTENASGNDTTLATITDLCHRMRNHTNDPSRHVREHMERIDRAAGSLDRGGRGRAFELIVLDMLLKVGVSAVDIVGHHIFDARKIDVDILIGGKYCLAMKTSLRERGMPMIDRVALWLQYNDGGKSVVGLVYKEYPKKSHEANIRDCNNKSKDLIANNATLVSVLDADRFNPLIAQIVSDFPVKIEEAI